MSRSASAAPRSPATVEKRRKQFGLLPDFGENLGLGIFGDVVGDGEGAEGAGSFGVHAALGNYLPVEVGQFLQKPDILQAVPGRAVRRSWCSGCRRRERHSWWSISFLFS